MSTAKTKPRAKRSTNQRELILDAAIRVVDINGAGHLTIDAVAAAGGVSKGGVLYHFPNKRALLGGMLDRLIEREFARLATVSGDTALQRHLHAARDMRSEDKAASLALLAAAAEEPDMLSVIKDAYRDLFSQARQEASDSVEANALLVATEGMRILSVLGVLPLTKSEQRAVHEHLAERAAAL